MKIILCRACNGVAIAAILGMPCVALWHVEIVDYH